MLCYVFVTFSGANLGNNFQFARGEAIVSLSGAGPGGKGVASDPIFSGVNRLDALQQKLGRRLFQHHTPGAELQGLQNLRALDARGQQQGTDFNLVAV